MEGRRGEPRTALMAEQDCDVWLLTRCDHHLELPDGYRIAAHARDWPELDSSAFKWWSAVATRRNAEQGDGDTPGTAAARVGLTTYASSILPWAGFGRCSTMVRRQPRRPHGAHHRRVGTVLRHQDRLVWGGDWTQAFEGKDTAASMAGQGHVVAMLDRLGLNVPASPLPHRIDGCCRSITSGWQVPARDAIRSSPPTVSGA